jgi:hypothetical protein
VLADAVVVEQAMAVAEIDALGHEVHSEGILIRITNHESLNHYSRNANRDSRITNRESQIASREPLPP